MTDQAILLVVTTSAQSNDEAMSVRAHNEWTSNVPAKRLRYADVGQHNTLLNILRILH